MAKILVTGGAGYIGSHTRYFLEKRGHTVVVAYNLSRGSKKNVPEGRLRVLDVRDTEGMAALLEREHVDAVVHFAAYIAVGESTQVPELYFSNNVAGSVSLFEAMIRTGVRHLVFSSTAAVYGTPRRVPIPEDEPFAPINPYGETKVMTEKTIEWLGRYRDFQAIRLRYFN
ncbi:MAG: NAD-dependent epimerase/dehydratase family protein, partial [Bryobacteraceae bacterium]